MSSTSHGEFILDIEVREQTPPLSFINLNALGSKSSKIFSPLAQPQKAGTAEVLNLSDEENVQGSEC
jgi:hypothetical protein